MKYFILILLLFIAPAMAEDLKPLPEVSTLGVNDFTAQSRLIEKEFDFNGMLDFKMQIPSNFIIKSDEQLKSVKKNNRYFGEIFHAYGPTIYDLRSYISIQSFEIDRLISGKNWFLAHALEKNYSIRRIEADKSEDNFEVFYVRIDDFGRSETVRSKGYLHQDRMILVEYVVPAKLFEQSKDKQIYTIKSFVFTNDYSIDHPERILSYEYLDSFSVQYPESWILTRKNANLINRHDVSFKTSDENNFLLASVDVAVLSRRSLKDIVDKAIYPINLGQQIKGKKQELIDKNVTTGDILERHKYDNLEFDTDIAVTEVYPLRRKKSDVFINDNENQVINEFWMTIIKTPKGHNKNYILSMIAPSRDIDFYNWAITKRAYELMVETVR